MAKLYDVIKSLVREEYGQAARQAKQGGQSCCGGVDSATVDPITGNLYEASQLNDLPPAVLATSLGCGNQTALTDLHEGETVLHLGSGTASMSCSQPAAWARSGRSMDWT